MSVTIAISVLVAILVCLIILFFSLGVRTQVYYNSEYDNITADIFLFSRLHLIKIKIFKVNGVNYAQVGNRNNRKLKVGAKVDKAVNKRPFNLTDAMSVIKGIRLRSLNIACYVGASEGSDTAMLYCGINSLIVSALNILAPIVREDRFDVVCVPDFDKSVMKLRADIAIGWGMLQIIPRILRNIYSDKRIEYGK